MEELNKIEIQRRFHQYLSQKTPNRQTSPLREHALLASFVRRQSSRLSRAIFRLKPG